MVYVAKHSTTGAINGNERRSKEINDYLGYEGPAAYLCSSTVGFRPCGNRHNLPMLCISGTHSSFEAPLLCLSRVAR